jgi:predicted N-acetyltransferase YhbS
MPHDPFTIIAPNKRAHAERIFDLVAEQWRDDLREQCRQGRINHSHYDWHTSRVGIVDGNLVTHFGVYDLTVRVGAARVRAAGVNLVVTHPDYRKQGLMPKTIWASIEAMRHAGYDLSIVANAVERYYERFGWRAAWPETHYFIAPGDLPAQRPGLRLHRWNTRHRPVLADLYNAENDRLTGTAVRPTFLRTKEPGELHGYLMLDPAGAVVGYIIYDIVSRGSALWHYDSAGDPDERLRALGMLARKLGVDEVRFNRLHHHSPLAQRLRARNCYAETRYAPSGGWMIQVVNLRALFEKLAPELSRRISCSHLSTWRGDLLIATSHERITLQINNAAISVAPPGAEPPEHAIEGGEEIALLVMGTESPAEIASSSSTTLKGAAADLLPILFPKQYPQMGNADL